ncbi:transcription intermediary factor 1-alpha-like isoform X2 [Coccinella septempunctata]|uniref:transcription intermediary factor 1-alpha-like isoform X2 n=1 Tax=Coccinella septempunctata TaxID=41139 RepID=UPI001D092055|nr:transcription intermediary factor 1-alpha-like isoform X2 [Coccinella septempunctata]
MAEQSVNFEENNIMSFLNTDHNPEETVPNSGNEVNLGLEASNNLSDIINDDQVMDEHPDHNILSTDSDQDQLNKESIETSSIPVNESGPEVESPTTGETFTFKCVFCEQILTFSDGPKLLECLHNSCSNCITSKLYDQSIGVSAKGAIECPICNLPSGPDKIIENQFLLEASNTDDAANSAASKAADLKCSSCSEDIIATSWCVDCAEFICDSCVQAHQRLKITKDHTIKPKDEGMMEVNNISSGMGVNLFCEVHPHEKLSLFCENCDKLTCRDCQLIEHREHKYKFTNEIASEARKYISDMLKDVGYKRVLLSSAMKVIDDRQTLIVEKKQALVKEITQLVVKLTNTINVRGKQLVSKLSDVCESKQKTLNEKKQALEQLSKMTDYCILFTQHALEKGSDLALLYSKKQVTEHLKRIKCRRADIPNPEIPVRIHLALDKVPELVKVMSTIGQIVVDGRIYPPPEQQMSIQQNQMNMISPIGSQSPGHSRPPQQQSPIGQIVPQNSHGNFQANKPPPYRAPFNNNQQFSHQNISPNMAQQNQTIQQALSPNLQHNNQSNMGIHRIQNMGPPAMVPMSSQGILAQQLNNIGIINRMQRPQMQRPMLGRGTNNSLGLTHQQQMSTKLNFQVSSSTHPQGLLHDRSALRGLLQHNSNPVYVQTGPSQYQAIQPGPHLAQFHARFSGQGQQNQGAAQVQVFRQQSPNNLMMQANNQNRHFQHLQQAQSQMQRINFPAQGAKWHIPQQCSSETSPGGNRNMSLPAINDNFKITLKQQNHTDSNKNPATVTSTIPKTPSPNHIQGRSDTERNLDKCCEDSVNDLMATIAKLDSNGVQVLAEGRQKSGGSPHVDSSTGDAAPLCKVKPECLDTGKDDPNEDWCAVCMDGGELVCCDKCPKVFHQYCHIPNLSVEETGDTWQCLLCMNFADIPETEKKDGELSLKERKKAERLVLELYCQYDPSLPFREVIGPDNIDYHAIIKTPMALDNIRQKLKWDSEERYRSLEDLVRDVRLMFRNAYNYNSADSLVYQDAKTLEKFFDEQLEKFLPEYAYENFEDDAGAPPIKKVRRAVND